MRLLVDLEPMEPALGLAIEEALLDSTRHTGGETMRMWVNRRAIIIGRSQSIAAEVDEAQAHTLGIPVLRRISGGGTVYHYPGNLNISLFLRKRRKLSSASAMFRLLGAVLTEALIELTPKLYSEDNGLYVDGLKVAGAAQAHRGAAILYHTTLLIQPPSIPMETLLLAMQPDYCSPTGIPSRPRAITSLSQHITRPIETNEVAALIINALASALGMRPKKGRLTASETAQATALSEGKYVSTAWNRRL